jgi:hypothetical protein
LLGRVALGGAAAALVSSASQAAALLPLSQKVGEVGGSLWERSSAVRSTIQAVRWDSGCEVVCDPAVTMGSGGHRPIVLRLEFR